MSLLVFGMDGVAKKYVEEAIDRGMMPNMEKLVSEGFISEMESTIPPTTIPAWVSMFSGCEPDSLGFYHMAELSSEGDGLSPSSSDIWKGEMVWDKADASFDLINVPGTSPVWPVEGVMVEGFPMVNDPSGYPEKVDEELDGLEFKTLDSVNTNRKKRKLLQENFDKRQDVFGNIGSNPDVRIEVYQLTDTASHKSETVDQLLESYSKIDDVLGERMEEFDDVLVVSDHGFKKIDTYFYINTWLKNRGYLELLDEEESQTNDLIFSIKSFLAGTRFKPFFKKLNDIVSSRSNIDFSPDAKDVENVDFKNSDAYCYRGSANSYADVNLNVPELKDEIKTKLLEEELIDEVFETEKIYDKKEGFPDLIATTVENAASGMQPAGQETFRTQAFVHQRAGIIAATGKSFTDDDIDEQYLVDIAPTIAYYLGQNIESDGKPITEIFKKDFKPHKPEMMGVDI